MYYISYIYIYIYMYTSSDYLYLCAVAIPISRRRVKPQTGITFLAVGIINIKTCLII